MTYILVFLVLLVFFIFHYGNRGFFKTVRERPSFIHDEGIDYLTNDEKEIVRFTNLFRISKDIKTLKVELELNIAAEKRVNAMILQGELNHKGFASMSGELMALGLTAVSENLGFGYSNSMAVVNSWIESESHRKNVEGDWTYIGIYIGADDKGKKYYCQIFAK